MFFHSHAVAREQAYLEHLNDGGDGGLMFVFIVMLGYFFWEILKGKGSYAKISAWKRVSFVVGSCSVMYMFPIVFYIITLLMCLFFLWSLVFN
ncbi:hypothetical protein CGT81_07175 [Vibrio cholerae]|nr:hypothetical protein CGT81_07175 [Vibrio cholerae]